MSNVTFDLIFDSSKLTSLAGFAFSLVILYCYVFIQDNYSSKCPQDIIFLVGRF